MRTPAPGRPFAVSSTCVVSRPIMHLRQRRGCRPLCALDVLYDLKRHVAFAAAPRERMTMTKHAPFEPGHPRDLAGYGRTPPHPRWPGGARIAVQFVLNYEEGG